MARLTVHVLDKDRRPIRGKRVYCSFAWFVKGEQYSDQEGVARFEHAPTGPAKVFVDGHPMVPVGVEEHTDVTVTLRD